MIFNEIQILPGDLILGDDDGLVVVARNDVPEVIEMTQKRVEKEQRIISALREGKTTLELFDFTNTLERIGLKEK
jgi:4-hydroxy-4-methyl-2-oxoglutarate aldolase